MKFDMKKAIDLAKEGMTREELMQYFGINEKEYYSCLKSFPKKDRETLRGLLISNGKRKKNNENNNNIPVTVLNEVKNVIYDTSFIISNYSDFENMDGVIIPEVLEQLIYQEKVNKNSKVKKLFHMILDGNCRLRLLHDDVINDNEVQWYEDKADMAIILWAKKLPNAEVYTCDKALAIRCLQQNIKYRYFNIESYEKKNHEVAPYGRRVENYNRLIRKDGDGFSILSQSGMIVYDEKCNVKRPDENSRYALKPGYMIIIKDKMMVVNGKYEFEKISKS